jgi:PTS system maltose and glucose-specific IIC component
MYILVGLIMAALYFLLFRFLILRFDLKTPGRESDETETRLYSKADYQGKAPIAAPPAAGDGIGHIIIAGLGGKQNIEVVDNCYTRLRVKVRDISTINEQQLKTTGAKGVIRSGNNVQVVYGLHVKKMREAVETAL